MNKTFQALFLVSILTSPVISQEPDTLDIVSGRKTEPADLQRDSSGVFKESREYTPLWESDTGYFVQGQDTLLQERQAPRVQADSVKRVEPDFSHSPSQAVMYALVLPGLGQGYNRKYYKIPIVWAAMGAAGYAITFNTRNYNQASRDYAQIPDDTNERYLRYWRRNLEISYIGLLLVYALQVIDAYVDAQLYSWDVSEDLSLKVAPSLQPLMVPGNAGDHVYGITCSIGLKRR